MNKNLKTSSRLKEAMERIKINPSDLSKKSGVSKSSISQYLSGLYKPSNVSAGQMAEVLHVNPVWLLGYDVPMILDDAVLQDDPLYRVTQKRIMESKDDVSDLMVGLIESLSMEYLTHNNPEIAEVIEAYVKLSVNEKNMIRKMLDLPPIDEKREEKQNSAS